MKHDVRISRSAERDMNRLPKSILARITHRVLLLETNPRPRGAKKLSNRDEYRIRIGDYRLLYAIDDSGYEVIIYAVGHRRDVYR